MLLGSLLKDLDILFNMDSKIDNLLVMENDFDHRLDLFNKSKKVKIAQKKQEFAKKYNLFVEKINEKAKQILLDAKSESNQIVTLIEQSSKDDIQRIDLNDKQIDKISKKYSKKFLSD